MDWMAVPSLPAGPRTAVYVSEFEVRSYELEGSALVCLEVWIRGGVGPLLHATVLSVLSMVQPALFSTGSLKASRRLTSGGAT
jgi:hypothetical protein